MLKLNLVFAVQIIAKSSESHERKYIYPCGNKFYKYYLDDEPAEYGLSAGEYAKGEKAYVGLADGNDIVLSGRVQLNPPGIYFSVRFQATFSNDSSKIWYLYKNPHHKYEWVNAKTGDDIPFSIDFGTSSSAIKIFISRIITPSNTVILGSTAPSLGVMFYVNEKGVSTTRTSGYQILTCKSYKRKMTFLRKFFFITRKLFQLLK